MFFWETHSCMCLKILNFFTFSSFLSLYPLGPKMLQQGLVRQSSWAALAIWNFGNSWGRNSKWFEIIQVFNATNPVLHTALKASKVRRDFFHELYSLRIVIISYIFIYIYFPPVHNKCLQYIMVGLMYVLFSGKERERRPQIVIPYITFSNFQILNLNGYLWLMQILQI